MQKFSWNTHKVEASRDHSPARLSIRVLCRDSGERGDRRVGGLKRQRGGGLPSFRPVLFNAPGMTGPTQRGRVSTPWALARPTTPRGRRANDEGAT